MKICDYLYFDTYATIPCSKNNNQFVMNYMNCFNPSNVYAKKEQKLIKNLINIIMNMFKCKENNIIINSGGSEGNSTILFNKAIFNNTTKNIVISNLDHPSILNKAIELSKFNINFRVYKAINGLYNVNDLMNIIDKNTSLVVLTSTFSEIGNNNNVEEIAKIIKKIYPDIFIHCDYVQGFMKSNKNITLDYIDSIAISFHKIGAMKGSGLLIVKDNIIPLISGKQNNNMRGGTIPIEILASAFYAIQENLISDDKNKPNYFMYLLNNIKNYVKDYFLYTNPNIALGNCLTIGFKNVKNKDIQDELCKLNIIVGTGTACSSNSINKNIHLFESFGEQSYLYYPLRISWCKKTTKNDIDILLNELIPIINKLSKKNGGN